MKVWATIGQSEVIQLLNGTLRCDPEKAITEGFAGEEERDWMASQMRNRIGNSPDGVRWPVWGFEQWENAKVRKPWTSKKERRKWLGNKDAPHFRVELDVPKHLMLASDFDDWQNMPNWPVFRNEKEVDLRGEKKDEYSLRYAALCRERWGTDDIDLDKLWEEVRNETEEPPERLAARAKFDLAHEALRQELVIPTWDLIFTWDWRKRKDRRNNRVVQVTAWEWKFEWVREITVFQAEPGKGEE